MEILLELPGRQGLASDLAQALGFSRVTARKYLDILAEAGYVEKLAVRSPSGSGRPRHLYKLKGDLL